MNRKNNIVGVWISVAVGGCFQPEPQWPPLESDFSSSEETTGGAEGDVSDTQTSTGEDTMNVDGSTIGEDGTGAGTCSGWTGAGDDGPYFVESGSLLSVSVNDGVLENDVVEGCGLVVIGFDAVSAEGGTVDLREDGGFLYTPPVSDFPYGTDRFSYTVQYEDGTVSSASVRVVVEAAAGVVDLGELGRKGFCLEGVSPNDLAGLKVRGAGDVNGDGFSDFLVGARYGDPHGAVNAGESYLIYGGALERRNGSLASADVRFEGIDADDRSGVGLNGAGDVNGDGYADILIGASGADSGMGEAYLIFGSSSLPNVLNLSDSDVRFSGYIPGAGAGYALSNDGDVNGDGYADILIGAHAADAGLVYLVYGGASFPSVVNVADSDVRFEGVSSGDQAGIRLNITADLNGDGYSDMVFGAVTADPGGASNAGEVYVVLGGADLPPVVDLGSVDLLFEGAYVGGGLGFDVNGSGDVNGDGYADLLVGEYTADPEGVVDAGSAYAVLGSETLLSHVLRPDVEFLGADSGGRLGSSVSVLGDVDGDGYDDVAIGASYPNVSGATGSTYLFRGGESLSSSVPAGSAVVRFDGNNPGDTSGMSVFGVGDANGDGFADFVVGEHLSDVTSDAGEACLVLGDDVFGVVTVLGEEDAGVEELYAVNGSARDVVVGGLGDDVLYSDGGEDVLRGGEGDDVLVVVDDSFFRVDGGLGEDALELVGAIGLPHTALTRRRVRGVERVILSRDAASSISLSERSILNISDTSNTLIVEGDSDDELRLLPGGWVGPIEVGGYREWSSASTSSLRLRVLGDVAVIEI